LTKHFILELRSTLQHNFRLKAWHERWQPPARENAQCYADWLAESPEDWPESLLAAAWLALLLDANPRPRANEKDVPSLLPRIREERDNLVQASASFMRLLASSHSGAELKQGMQAGKERELIHHADHLVRFKGF
jgi:hypothetical protein